MESSSTGRKLQKSSSGLRMVPLSDSYACPFALAEPVWISDQESESCSSCGKRFDFFNRKNDSKNLRDVQNALILCSNKELHLNTVTEIKSLGESGEHHCRRCGCCFCDRCCHHILPLKRLYFVDPVRQCYDCAVVSKDESEFYEKSLKILFDGCDFLVSDHSTGQSIGNWKCSLSPDHRQIIFKNSRSSTSSDKMPLLFLSRIQKANFVMGEADAYGAVSKIPIGWTITFKDAEDSAVLHEETFKSVNEKAAVPWLVAFQKALKYLFEARETS